MDIEKQVRACVINSGMAMTQLSYATKIPLPTLYDFRNRKQTLALGTLQKLCDFFKLELKPKKVRTK